MKKLLLIFLLLPCVLKGQIITNFAGGGATLGDGGPATSALVNLPAGGCFDHIGNYYFFESFSNPRIRMVDTSGIINTVAGNGMSGYNGDGGPATSAKMRPQGFTVDKWGNIIIGDFYNNRLRKVDAVTHIITTIAGNGTSGFSGDGGPAISATVSPTGVCTDTIGNIYFVDQSGARIRKIDTSGIITTVAGNGISGNTGDGGLAINAEVGVNTTLCIDKKGNLYLPCGTKIRKVDLNTGIISSIAGNGNFAYIGDGMHADSAQFNAFNIGIDKYANIYIADESNDRAYKIDTNNIFHLIAGTGTGGYNGDGGLADTSQLYDPEGVTVDACGNIYIADESNKRIRKVAVNPDCSPIDTTTSIQRITTQNSINFFPNPTQNELTITAGSNIKELAIINAMGQRVLSQNCNGMKQTVQTSGLSAGVYFVVLRDERGEVWRGRFVKE